MPKFEVKKTFKGALRGCFVREFAEGQIVEIDDTDLARVALEEGWIESHVEPITEPEGDEFPEDYAEYVVLGDLDLPEHLHEMAGAEKLGAGSEIGMSAAQAQELVEAGLIAPKPETVEPAAPKAKEAAPKNKAAKAAPKSKDAATE